LLCAKKPGRPATGDTPRSGKANTIAGELAAAQAQFCRFRLTIAEMRGLALR